MQVNDELAVTHCANVKLKIEAPCTLTDTNFGIQRFEGRSKLTDCKFRNLKCTMQNLKRQESGKGPENVNIQPTHLPYTSGMQGENV